MVPTTARLLCVAPRIDCGSSRTVLAWLFSNATLRIPPPAAPRNMKPRSSHRGSGPKRSEAPTGRETGRHGRSTCLARAPHLNPTSARNQAPHELDRNRCSGRAMKSHIAAPENGRFTRWPYSVFRRGSATRRTTDAVTRQPRTRSAQTYGDARLRCGSSDGSEV